MNELRVVRVKAGSEVWYRGILAGRSVHGGKLFASIESLKGYAIEALRAGKSPWSPVHWSAH